MSAIPAKILRVSLVLFMMGVIVAVCAGRSKKSVPRMMGTTEYPLPPSGPCSGDTYGSYPGCYVHSAQNGAITFVAGQINATGYWLNKQSTQPTMPAGANESVYWDQNLGLVAMSQAGELETLLPQPTGFLTAFSSTVYNRRRKFESHTTGPSPITFDISPLYGSSNVNVYLGFVQNCNLLLTVNGRVNGVGDGGPSYGDSYSTQILLPTRSYTVYSTAYVFRMGVPTSVVVDPSYAYWTDVYANNVAKISLIGGNDEVIASSQTNPSGLSQDSSNIYWVDSANTRFDGGTGTGQVMQWSKAGGAPATIATGVVESLYTASNGSTVVYSDSGQGLVLSVPVGGGTVTTLASGRSNPEQVAIDSSNVYWVDNAGVFQEPLSLGAITTIYSGSGQTGLAIDSSYVYFSGSNINKTPIGGGSNTVLGSNSYEGANIRVDDTFVYWDSTYSGGTYPIFKVPKTGGSTISFSATLGASNGIALQPPDIYSVYVYYSAANGYLARTNTNGGQQPIGAGPTVLSVFADPSQSSDTVTFSYSGQSADQNDPGVIMTITAPSSADGTTITWTVNSEEYCNN